MPVLCFAALASFAPAPLPAQLPSNPPTQSATPVQTTAPLEPSTSESSPARTPHHSQVTYAAGKLTVVATNASLAGLIREIARQTGMKVSGNVTDDRVFGTYGPADPQKIIATLLDGTGINILIVSNTADSPLELVLTPRTGAASPPSANTSLAGNTDDEDDNQGPPPGSPVTTSAPRNRAATIPGSIPPTGSGDPTGPPPAGTDTTTDPSAAGSNAVKTPQQIFEQLQRLRQAATTSQTPQ